MKYFVAKLPQYFEILVGISLVVVVAQYALITGVVRPDHPVLSLFQLGFYILLAASVFRGITQRSRFAWLVVQVMLIALFASSVLFAAVCAALSLKAGAFWMLVFTVVLTALVNGLLIALLFTLPVCDYFSPREKDQ